MKIDVSKQPLQDVAYRLLAVARFHPPNSTPAVIPGVKTWDDGNTEVPATQRRHESIRVPENGKMSRGQALPPVHKSRK